MFLDLNFWYFAAFGFRVFLAYVAFDLFLHEFGSLDFVSLDSLFLRVGRFWVRMFGLILVVVLVYYLVV